MVIYSRVPQPEWDKGDPARCLKFPPRPRDPETGRTDDAFFDDAREALPICNGDFVGTPCPKRTECRLWALVNNDAFGVFGGLTSVQRKWVQKSIPREFWGDDEYVYFETPGPDYFKTYGDEDDLEDDSVPT